MLDRRPGRRLARVSPRPLQRLERPQPFQREAGFADDEGQSSSPRPERPAPVVPEARGRSPGIRPGDQVEADRAAAEAGQESLISSGFYSV